MIWDRIKEVVRNVVCKDLLLKIDSLNKVIDVQSQQIDVLIGQVNDYKNKLEEEKYKHAISVVEDLYSDEDTRPTESNKPSAHSSLTFEAAYNTLYNTFPEPVFKIFTVSNTNSMEPFIDANSLIIAEKINSRVLSEQPLTVGDICIYETTIRGVFYRIIHRIKAIDDEKQRYMFLGDNNIFVDGWVVLDAIKYRYVGQVQLRQIEAGD